MKIIKILTRKSKFEDVADEWLEEKKDYIKESTYCEYLGIIEKQLKKKYKNVYMRELFDLDKYIKELEKTLKPKTIRGIITVLKSILRFYEDKYDCTLKIRCKKLPKINKTKVIIFNKNETVKLKNYCAQNSEELLNIGILISLYTGMRIGEICALKWKDVNLSEKIIYVKKTAERIDNCVLKETKIIIDSPKTENSIRNIPIPSKLYKILKTLKNKYNNDCYVLSGTNKIIEPRMYQKFFKKVLKKNNIKQRKFHSLRHTFATNCIEVGMDVKSLSELLGHSSVNTTLNVYVHSTDSLKKKYLEKL